MANCHTVRSIALALPKVEEKPYRHGTSFRINGKVLATLWEDKNEAVLKATPDQQKELIKMNSEAFYTLPHT